jgi:hypothetical protein
MRYFSIYKRLNDSIVIFSAPLNFKYAMNVMEVLKTKKLDAKDKLGLCR